jgi:ferredoxin
MRPKGSGQKLHYLKLTLQFSLLVFSVILIAVGLWGPQFAPKNLTTLFVWVHYRGFLVLGLLVWGNIFCMSCPFIFVRNCIRIFIAPKYLWPKKLQNKWIGLLLFCSVLFFYEYLSLWSSPFKTALLIIAFFAGALLTDLLFKKATFCKYLCPIGQFNFLASTLSPKEVKAKSLSVCQSCSTQDCLRGNKELQLRGCELHLLMPKKKGNLDCTFCMDCVAACPYENIHVASRIPSAELWQDTHRSGVGLLTQRKDIQAYIIAFTFGGLLNAFAMTSSAQLLKEKMKIMLNFQNEFLFLLFLFFIFLIVLPIFLLIIPEKISQKNSPKNYNEKFKLLPSLLPLGFAVWLAHYSFHLLTGFFTFVPLVMTQFSMPLQWMGLRPSIVTPIQMGLLTLGFIGSVIVSSSISQNKKIQFSWVAAHFTIALLAFWILSMPMDMRGTFVGLAP